MVEIRLPNITGATEKEQLLQLKSYLYQLSEQLQWAFDNIGTSGGEGGTTYVVNEVTRPSGTTGTSGASAEATFSSIKALIIKSADIINAYYEEINKRLEGAYVSQSDFGVYAETTALEIEANSKGINQHYEDVQIIVQETKDEVNIGIADINSRIDETDSAIDRLDDGISSANSRIEGIEGSLEETKTNMSNQVQEVANSVSTVDRLLESAKAQLQGSLDDLTFSLEGLRQIVVGVTDYVKSGLLYYTVDGIPVYGIEIGQEVENTDGEVVFNKFSRFTSEKLSFYDSNGNEVAYISDKKLYIGQAEITISLKVGGLVDLVMTNGDVVTKWEGVSG